MRNNNRRTSAAATGTLAGCMSNDGNGNGNGDDNNTGNSSSNENGDTDESSGNNTSKSHSVTMEPVGAVEFDSVPETWVTENTSWADMGVALGLDKPSAVVLTSEYRTWHYEDIPELSTSKEDMVSLWQDGISKELLIELNADAHFIFEDITERVGPFCGNTSFSTCSWHEDNPSYSLYEATKKVAQVFQRMDRYDTLVALHDTFLRRIQERLPPESERPAIALLSPASVEPETFYPSRLGDTTAYKHWHDLGVSDALENSYIQSFTSDRGEIDYEPLLEIDPEVLMFYTDKHWSRSDFRDQYLAFLQNHNTASQLTAVQNGNVYPAGGMPQGPIINFSKTERAAKQLFPEEFDKNEQLYDRQKIADIRAGDL